MVKPSILDHQRLVKSIVWKSGWHFLPPVNYNSQIQLYLDFEFRGQFLTVRGRSVSPLVVRWLLMLMELPNLETGYFGFRFFKKHEWGPPQQSIAIGIPAGRGRSLPAISHWLIPQPLDASYFTTPYGATVVYVRISHTGIYCIEY
jgi:hypothetical protein